MFMAVSRRVRDSCLHVREVCALLRRLVVVQLPSQHFSSASHRLVGLL